MLEEVCIVDESVSTPDYMPPYNGVGVSSLIMNMVTTVGNAANVTVTVDPAAAATVSQVIDLQNQIDDLKGYTGYMDEDIYGVEVDFVNKKCTRLAGAVGHSEGEFFDNLTPWGGRKRVIVIVMSAVGCCMYLRQISLNTFIRLWRLKAEGK